MTELEQILSDMAPDELKVMLVLARRLLEGQRLYGKLNLAADKRDFRKERSMEIQDLLIYSAFAELQMIAAGAADV